MIQKYQNSSVEQEIDIMEYVAKIWKKRILIVKWCVVGAIVGLVIGFSIPKTYKASVTLAPETQQKIGSGVSSIASMMGVSIDNSVDAISVQMFPDVVSSTPFIYELFDLPVTFERKDSVINTTLVDYMINYQQKPWWSHVFSAPFRFLGWVKSIGKEPNTDIQEKELDPQNLPAKHRNVVRALSKGIILNIDKRTDKIYIVLELQDPDVVATVVKAIQQNLTKFITDYRTSKIRQDIENLSVIYAQRKEEFYIAQDAYANYVDANRNVVLLSAQVEMGKLKQEMDLTYQVYTQVATQLEAARIKEQEAKPVFAVLEPVCTPLRPSAPSKFKLLVVFTFLAGCCAVAWILFGQEVFSKQKNKSEE